jgi:hypothetical protein
VQVQACKQVDDVLDIDMQMPSHRASLKVPIILTTHAAQHILRSALLVPVLSSMKQPVP